LRDVLIINQIHQSIRNDEPPHTHTDYDYRGPVGVVLFNHGQEDFPGAFLPCCALVMKPCTCCVSWTWIEVQGEDSWSNVSKGAHTCELIIRRVTTTTTTITHTVKKGDRVAQMILERICMAPVVEVEELPETARYVPFHAYVFGWGFSVYVYVCVCMYMQTRLRAVEGERGS
jgi:hypothetical protein